MHTRMHRGSTALAASSQPQMNVLHRPPASVPATTPDPMMLTFLLASLTQKG